MVNRIDNSHEEMDINTVNIASESVKSVKNCDRLKKKKNLKIVNRVEKKYQKTIY